MKNVCQFVGTGSTTYSIASVPNITSFIWTVPANATILSGQGTTSISVSFSSAFTSGNITVSSVGFCSNSDPTSVTVTYAPPTPGVITGATHICPQITSATPITYSVAAVMGATSYNWTVPTGGTLLSGAGTRMVTILFDSTTVTGTMLKVVAVNGCTVSPIRSVTLFACATSRISNFTDTAKTTIASDLYPSPTTDFFNLNVTVDADKEIVVAVFDVMGNEVLEERHDVVQGENTITTNVNALSTGLYFVQVIDLTNNTVEIRKLVKE